MIRESIRRMTWTAATLMVVAFGIVSPTQLTADEPAEQFLEELRRRRFFDTAIDYLEQMESSNLANARFRRVIPFEKGVTLIESSAFTRDAAIKKKMLDEAQIHLDRFIEEQPNHELVAIAKNRLANLLIQRAEVNIINSKKRGLSQADRDALLTEARQQYEEAGRVFTKTREELNAKLRAIDPNNQDARFKRLRDQYRSEFLQTLLLLPAVKEQKADTYAEGDAERTKLLEDAAADYKEVFDKYRDWEAAFYARIYEARCYAKVGKHEDAVRTIADILDQDNSPEFREFKKMALLIGIDSWAELPADESRPFELISHLEPLLATVPESDVQEEWLKLRMSLARAYRDAGAALDAREEKSADDRRQITTYNNLATQLIRDISKVNGPHKQEAQQLLVDWGVSRNVVDTEEEEPTNFGEARKRGRTRLDDYETAKFAANTLAEKIKTTEDLAERVALQTQLEEVQQTIQTSPDEALHYFRMALNFAEEADEEEEIASDDITTTYYFMAYVLFNQQQLEHVGVIAEHLLRTAPQGAGTRETCDLALSAYWVLYTGGAQNDREFEMALLRSMSDGILTQWPGQAEGIKASTLMSWVELEAGNLDGAESYLQKIPEESPQRYESELAIGQSIWKQYLNKSNQIKTWQADETADHSAEIEAAKAESEILIGKALTYLEAGCKKLAPDTIDEPKAIASLALAQAYLTSDQVEKAIAHLENAKVGLLTLLDQKHVSVESPWTLVNTYKTAVRAYIGALKNSSSKQLMIDNALSIMSKLKTAVGDTPEGRQQLIGIYLGLANDLKSQMDELPSAAEKKTFALGLTAFLDEIRQDSEELNTLVWVARTLAGIGESFAAEGMDADAAPLFQKAGLAFVTILDKGKASPDWLPDNVRIEVTRQLARNRRNQGNYEDAIQSYAQVLAEKSSYVDVQVEAAEAYQLWAESTRSSDHYKSAMIGGIAKENPETGRKQNVIWGWGKIAQVAARYPNYRDRFFVARYNLAKCRFEYSQIEDSRKQLDASRRDILQTYRLDENLGGREMKAKFDLLLREIQKELGTSSPQGLKAFDTN